MMHGQTKTDFFRLVDKISKSDY